MKVGDPGVGGGGGGVAGRAAVVRVATAWTEVGMGASEATERMCQTPSTGSVTVRTSIPAPVEVSSGEPGPWSTPLGLMAKTSRSVGTVLVQVYVMVSFAVIVSKKVAAGEGSTTV